LPTPRDETGMTKTPGLETSLIIRSLALVSVVCALVYLPWLGTAWFAASEGHRVVPAWTMAHLHDFSVSEMFERGYIRKPPGIAWAIALFFQTFGFSTWSARAVSALSAAVAACSAYLFARRWFNDSASAAPGPRANAAALSVGLAQALLPLLWLPGGPGRTAEIEMLLLLGTQWAALALVTLLLPRTIARPSWVSRIFLLALVAAGCFIAGITKGAASLPVLLGVLGACFVIRRDADTPLPLRDGIKPLAAAAIGCAGAFLLVRHIWSLNDGPTAVHETGSFLWTDIAGVVSAPFIALASAAPVSLALVFIPGRDARAEAAANPTLSRARTVARLLAIAWCLSALTYFATGVSNPRYLLPATVLLPGAVGYVVLGLGDFGERRRRIARLLLLGRGHAWVVLLSLGALVSAYLFAHRQEAQAGREAGEEIAVHHPPVIIADGLIEARPDILLAARLSMLSKSPPRVLWKKPVNESWSLKPAIERDQASSVAYALRIDEGHDERPALAASLGLSVADLLERARGRVGRYEWALVDVPPRAENAQQPPAAPSSATESGAQAR